MGDGEQCIDWVMYAALAFFLWFAVRAEVRDVRCPSLPGETPESCALGADIAFQGSRPRPGDPPGVLLDKIVDAAKGIERSIVWRKSLIGAIAIALLFFGIVIRRVPPWQEFYITCLLAFVVNVQIANFYKHHVYRQGIRNTEKAVKQLRGVLGA